MSRKDAHLDHLAQVPMLRGLNRKHLETVAKQGTVISYEAGKKVITEGETGEEFFVVVEGSLTVSAGGREFAQLGPGDFFGELALFDPAPRDATVTATTDSQLLVIGAREFAPLMEDVPSLARKVAAGLAKRVREADRQRLLG